MYSEGGRITRKQYKKNKKGKFAHIKKAKQKGYVKPGFHHVHHKNKNIHDNRSKNLEIKYNSEHRLHHDIERKENRLKKYKL